MKYKKSTQIVTDEICSKGCGLTAKFKTGGGKLLCEQSANSCPAVKKKNSDGLKQSYKDGRSISNFGGKQNWRKGLDISDKRVKANADSQRGGTKIQPPMSDITKNKLSKARIKVILEGSHDSSGRKGHRGHYDNVYFHSSWELAYYVFIKEMTAHSIQRNSKTVFKYMFEDRIRRYVPDFIVDDNYVEIKGYLYGERDHAKFNQTKDKVIYKFSDDLQAEFKYCKDKYGNQFWDVLYADD